MADMIPISIGYALRRRRSTCKRVENKQNIVLKYGSPLPPFFLEERILVEVWVHQTILYSLISIADHMKAERRGSLASNPGSLFQICLTALEKNRTLRTNKILC